MKVLVTGGAGFIGSNLVRRMLADPGIDSVVVIDDLSTGFEENIAELNVDFVRGSILDDVLLKRASQGVDAIVHLAAIGSVPRSVDDPIVSHEANATGTLRVLEAAREMGGAQVVLASSSSVYGANTAMPKTESLQCLPMSPYAVSKLASEQYAMAFKACYGLPVLPFRFFNVYGPRQRAGHVYAAVVPAFVDAALRGQALSINGDGMQSRDFTYVGTVTEVLTDAILRKVCASPTNLAFGTRTTLHELVRHLEQELGMRPTVHHGPDRPGDVKHSQADNARLRSLFPDVVPTDLRTGLGETIAWMRSEIGGVRMTDQVSAGEDPPSEVDLSDTQVLRRVSKGPTRARP